MDLRAAIRSFEGKPPAFLARGLMLRSDGGPVEFPLRRATETSSSPCVPSRADLAALRTDIVALRSRADEARQGKGQSALALAVQLRRLRERHNIDANPSPLLLGPPCEAGSIRIRGYAATPDVDDDRARFLPACWPALEASKIRLLMSHDPNRVAGTIDAIAVDALGRVVVDATVTDPAAMRLPGLSISASVERFTVRNPDSPTLMVGEIESVREVNEISLTSTPANRRCLVFERTVPTAVDLSFDDMLGRIRKLQAMVVEMKAA